ncbi:uncharacterized protein LOC118224183 [Anguilla anguilla]|uniref:uncharacterized protein LOC118224183 n=1 Tax=Anguilla anguilla TaxID=7936 RepID=UPI0015A8B4AB|nr:uncharacterized protein LOC118224183 [Anguilla anguilla]
MGCTPSKSISTYTQERVCQDLDTCSTFVPSLKSSVSTPERPSPRLCLETSSGKQTFLSVPCRDCHGRTLSEPNSPDAWSTFSTTSNTNPLCTPQPSTRASTKPSCSDSESSDSETPSSNERGQAEGNKQQRVHRCRPRDKDPDKHRGREEEHRCQRYCAISSAIELRAKEPVFYRGPPAGAVHPIQQCPTPAIRRDSGLCPEPLAAANLGDMVKQTLLGTQKKSRLSIWKIHKWSH